MRRAFIFYVSKRRW